MELVKFAIQRNYCELIKLNWIVTFNLILTVSKTLFNYMLLSISQKRKLIFDIHSIVWMNIFFSRKLLTGKYLLFNNHEGYFFKIIFIKYISTALTQWRWYSPSKFLNHKPLYLIGKSKFGSRGLALEIWAAVNQTKNRPATN